MTTVSEMSFRTESTEGKNAFLRKLEARWSEGKFVCVGLDSDYDQIPPVADVNPGPWFRMFMFNKAIVDTTHDFVCAYKPNVAFYEAQGELGLSALKSTIAYIKEHYPDIPVILDAKRADIGNTNKGYVKAAFDELGADAVTVNPYFGGGSLKPFSDREDKGIVVLVRTSNPEAAEIQDLPVDISKLPQEYKDRFGDLSGLREIEGTDIIPLYRIIAYAVSHNWETKGNRSIVVGATYPEELEAVRKIVGKDMPILIPGVGAQGGDLEKTVRAGGRNIILNSARGIIFASKGEDFAEAARREAEKLNKEVNFYLKHPEGLTEAQEKLASLMFDTKTVAPVKRRIELPDGGYKFEQVERPTAPLDFAQPGEFALKLHETQPDAPLSPVYINLRKLPQEIIDQIGVVMAEVKTSEVPNVCTGIPKAGVPLAQSYSEKSGIPYVDVFEKEETEQGRRIVAGEGEGEKRKLRIVDDMVTEGHTKLEAVRAAEQMGFKVTEILVVIDREQGARKQLEEAGCNLVAAFTLSQLLRYGLRTKRITKDQYGRVQNYFSQQK